MGEKIRLPRNHVRSLSSSLIVVEKSLIELEEILLRETESCCSLIVRDVDGETLKRNLDLINEAKAKISALADKYGVVSERLSLKRVIRAKRTRMWEILTDTQSGRMKGYGTFPEKYATQFDSDIKELLEITDKISCR